MACEPNTLANDAKCMCLSVEQHMQVQTLLLAQLAGGSVDPNTLSLAARCFCGIPLDTLMAMKSYLLCQFLGEENGGDDVLPAGPGDEDFSLTLDENFFAIVNVSDNGSGFTEYTYRFKINEAVDWTIAGNFPVDTGSFVDDYEPGDDVEVQARYMDGLTPLSEWSSSKFLTPCDGLEGVSGVDAGTDRGVDTTGYIVSVIWLPQPQQEVVSALEVQRADAIGGPYVTLASIPPAATAHQDVPVSPQTTYYYRILTVFLNGGCDSIASDPKEVATGCLVETVVQTAPDNISSDSADIHWNSPSVEPILGYEVRWGTTNGGPYTESSGALAPGEITYSISAVLNPSTTYYVIVIVKDTLTCTVNSNQQSFTTLA